MASPVDIPTVTNGNLLRGPEVYEIIAAMKGTGLEAEAERIKGHIDALQSGASLEQLLSKLAAALATNTEVIRQVTNVQQTTTDIVRRWTRTEEQRLEFDRQRADTEKAAMDAKAAIDQAATQEAAKTERFRIQNRRLIIVAVVGSLGTASGLGALLLALLEKL